MSLDEDEEKLRAHARRRGKIPSVGDVGHILWITLLVVLACLLYALAGYREWLIWAR